MTRPDESDESWMTAWRGGDRAAGEALCARLARPFAVIAHALCGIGPLAEEAVQEAFVRLVRSAPTWAEGAPLRPWAYALARNAARDLLRRRRRARPLEAAPEPFHTETPETALLRREDAEAAAAKLESLPAIHREVLVLRYGLGVDGDTLAALLEITRAALWTRLSRARAELRRRVRDDV